MFVISYVCIFVIMYAMRVIRAYTTNAFVGIPTHVRKYIRFWVAEDLEGNRQMMIFEWADVIVTHCQFCFGIYLVTTSTQKKNIVRIALVYPRTCIFT
jgi:predicted permease